MSHPLLQDILEEFQSHIRESLPDWNPIVMIDNDSVEKKALADAQLDWILCCFHYRKTHLETIQEYFGKKDLESASFWMRILFKVERSKSIVEAH